MGRTNAEQTDLRDLKAYTITDPGVNSAVSTAILDVYSGVIITTTTTGNAQTLQTPTNTNKIKRFSVVNDASSTNAITINGISLGVGEVKYFVWDGDEWTAEQGNPTSIVGITGTLAEFNTALTDENFVSISGNETISNKTLGTNLAAGGFQITGLGATTNGTDAATKDYTDNLFAGIKWKDEVDLATTGNITLSGEQTIDGVLTSTSRVLVKDQTDQTTNGIYTTSSGAWTRTTDADTGTELVASTMKAILGSTNANKVFVNTNSAITLGATNITYVTFGSIISHNNTTGTQGGTTNEKYHLTNTQHTDLTFGFTGTGNLVRATSPTLITPEIGVATGTSLDLGGTTLLASRSLTVDTGGVFNIATGNASGDDFTINTSQFVVEGDTGNVGIGLTPTANMVGLSIEAGVLTLKETTTPTADTNYGKIYNKTDNQPYFQDGAGSEHGFMLLDGAQTVAGVKTFSSFPVTPSSAPTTDYQVANKKYVDDNAGGGGVSEIFSAYRSTTQGMTTSDVTIAFDTEVVDSGGNYATTGVYTAPSDGTYYFTGIVTLNGATSGDSIRLGLYKNTGFIMQNISTAITANEWQMSIGYILTLTASDTIELKIKNNTASRGNISASSSVFMGYKLA